MAIYRNSKTGAEVVTESVMLGAWVRVDEEKAPKSEPKKEAEPKKKKTTSNKKKVKKV